MKTGRKENRKRKNKVKNDIFHCLVERGERKVMGPTSFLSFPFKIQSLQIGEKIKVKSGKIIWTKLPQSLINVFGLLFIIYFILDDFLYYFLKCPLSSIHNLKKKYNVLLFLFYLREI